MKTWTDYNDFILANKTNDLSESQPTKGNIEGGLTTIEEKAFGNLQKIGKKAKFIDVLEPAEAPGKGPRPLFHGHFLGRRRMRDLAGRRRFRRAICSRPARAM